MIAEEMEKFRAKQAQRDRELEDERRRKLQAKIQETMNLEKGIKEGLEKGRTPAAARQVERHAIVRSKLRPWVAKKIAEYLGEEEPTLIDFVLSCLDRRARPEEILDELALVLEEDAQVLVVKLWRVLLFHAAKAATA
ncbi:small nuclear ribonucleoprotein [Aureococcus anophagefferens]|uniref:Small nuclear ribonucleoprotein n=1 Tax=Aureococcus anophagefferens TaxID=44056 RepID=A0ABR1FL76_AURAN